MDFTNRSPAPKVAGESTKAWKGSPMWLKVFWVVLLFSATVLVLGIVALLYFNNPKESKFVAEDKVQAIFLDSGEYYFGNIRSVNDQYIDLQNIYYLRVSQPVQPVQEGQQQNSNILLQRLGCELHGPIDQMIINRDHVKYWENLKTDGTVSKGIQQWLDQNPDGLKCDAPANNQ